MGVASAADAQSRYDRQDRQEQRQDRRDDRRDRPPTTVANIVRTAATTVSEYRQQVNAPMIAGSVRSAATTPAAMPRRAAIRFASGAMVSVCPATITQGYVVNDYNRYGLRAPPRGYHYVRSGNDVVLAAVAGGLITAVIAGLFN